MSAIFISIDIVDSTKPITYQQLEMFKEYFD